MIIYMLYLSLRGTEGYCIVNHEENKTAVEGIQCAVAFKYSQ